MTSDITHPIRSTDRFFDTNWTLRPYEAVPLPVAVKLADLITEACRILHEPTHLFLGDPAAPPLSDEFVAGLLDALQAQLDREGESRTRGAICSRHGVKHERWYVLRSDLPPARQRALAERVWALWKESGVEVKVWLPTDPSPPQPQTPIGEVYWPHDYTEVG